VKAIVIKADMSFYEQNVTFEDVRKIVGGYVTATYPRHHSMKGLVVLVDEDGLMKRLPDNDLASIICCTPLVGDAVIVRNGGEDFLSLTHQDVFDIKKILTELKEVYGRKSETSVRHGRKRTLRTAKGS